MTLLEQMAKRLEELKAEQAELLRQMEVGQANLNAYNGAISELENWVRQMQATPEPEPSQE